MRNNNSVNISQLCVIQCYYCSQQRACIQKEYCIHSMTIYRYKGKVEIWNSALRTGFVIQYRLLTPAPVNRTSASGLSVHIPMHGMSNNKTSTYMNYIAYESKLLSFLGSFMHPWLGNWVAIRHKVVYYAWDAHAFSAEIKCRHCKCRVLEICSFKSNALVSTTNYFILW